MLHTINKSPFESNLILHCLRIAGKGDVIIFIEDGVYSALTQQPYYSELQQAIQSNHCHIYALLPDLLARGIAQDIASSIQPITYDEFVDLTIIHHPIQAWH